jgi:hypothetical protein
MLLERGLASHTSKRPRRLWRMQVSSPRGIFLQNFRIAGTLLMFDKYDY